MDDILINFSHLILSLTDTRIVTLIATIGFLAISKKTFSKAIILILITMPLNAYLKSIFKIPLNPTIGKIGWAFPSGHMQTAFVFWGIIFWEYKNIIIRFFVGALMICIGFALVYLRYHNIIDILGAIGFGLVELMLFKLITNRKDEAIVPLLGFLLAWVSLFLINVASKSHNNLWLACGGLFGFSTGYYLTLAQNLKSKTYITLPLGVAGAVLIYLFAPYLLKQVFKSNVAIFAQFFILTFWVSFAAEKIANITNKIKN
ncbi:MAG: phosphatase PAP2 family protein [Sphingobacteriia bacterium]|nr:phosphatase PAP2 family protein [Sphingobacteriia bacterium]